MNVAKIELKLIKIKLQVEIVGQYLLKFLSNLRIYIVVQFIGVLEKGKKIKFVVFIFFSILFDL